MKLYVFALCTMLVTAGARESSLVPDTRAPQLYSQIVSEAAFARIEIAIAKKESEAKAAVVRDREWLDEFSKVLARAVYQPQSHILAISPNITFFSEDGRRMLTIEVLPGGVLRLDGEDYRVGEKTTSALGQLIVKQAKG